MRVKTGLGITRVMTCRSPAGPPRAPAPPLPFSLMRVPSFAPAGMRTRMRRSAERTPLPRQSVQGSSMIVPAPPHSGQVSGMEKPPMSRPTEPRPSQAVHSRGLEPEAAPDPEQVGQASVFSSVTGTSAPDIAWSNARVTSTSRSCPRRAGAACACPPLRPAPPNIDPNRSPRSPNPAAPPPDPAPPPKPPPMRANWRSASYSRRFSGSDSTSCACEMSLKRSSAAGSSGLASGWCLRARAR